MPLGTLSYFGQKPVPRRAGDWVGRILEIEGALLLFPAIAVFLIGFVVMAVSAQSPLQTLGLLALVILPCVMAMCLMVSGMALCDGESWAPAVAGVLLAVTLIPLVFAVLAVRGDSMMLLGAGTAFTFQSVLLGGLVYETVRVRDPA